MNEQGFIVLYRQLLEWKYFMFPNAVTLWVYILLKANWKDGYFLGNEIPRGSFATSIAKISADTGISESSIKRWLKRFEEDGQIERKSTNRCTIIKASNYAAFQGLPDELVNQQMNHQVTDQVNYQMTDQVTDQVNHNRTKKQRNKETKKQKRERGTAVPPALEDVKNYCLERKNGIDPERFVAYYDARDWKIGGARIKDWTAAIRLWEERDKEKKTGNTARQTVPLPDYFREINTDEPAEEDHDDIIRQIREAQEKMK